MKEMVVEVTVWVPDDDDINDDDVRQEVYDLIDLTEDTFVKLSEGSKQWST